MSASRASSVAWCLAPFVALSLFWSDGVGAQTAATLPDYVIEEFGEPPAVPDDPLPGALRSAVMVAFVDSIAESSWGAGQTAALAEIAAPNDLRIAWLNSDMMRFFSSPSLHVDLAEAAAELLEVNPPAQNHWEVISNHLIAWDIPAPPDYLEVKRAIYTIAVPGWDRIFVEGDIDWRMVSWGGVLIDDWAYGRTDEPCNCIPAADYPEVSTAEEAAWLDDDDIVFGIEVNGEYWAYPRRIMELREMVNDTLGGRDLGIPYLCSAAPRRPISPTGCQLVSNGRCCAPRGF